MIRARRIVAGFIDHFIILVSVSLIAQLIDIISGFRISLIVWITTVCLYLILMFLRDIIFYGLSLGKRLMKLNIVSYSNRVTTLVLIKRNLWLIIFPLEIILIIFNGKRIGDIFTDTDVVEAKWM